MEGGVCKAAGGVVMQLLPGTTEENMDKAEERMQAFVNAAEVVENFGADGIMREYFSEITENSGVYLTFPEYKCNCSRKKIANVITSIGKSEFDSIIAEQGKVSVHCHYCNKDYEFFNEDGEKLFK